MQLLLLGCTGFIGEELVPRLLNQGHQLFIVSRNKRSAVLNHNTNKLVRKIIIDPSESSSWNNLELLDALNKSEGVINLAGEPIAEKRWTQEHCRKLKNSRLSTTLSLINAMENLKKKPKVLINASAIGYYGSSLDKQFKEESPCGAGFLSSLCKEWENLAANKPNQTRLTIIRFGIVIGPNGGALKKMLPVFKTGLGGPIGHGNQWISWIQRTDICRIIETAIQKPSWSGVINGVAPQPVSMNNFAAQLGSCLGRPSLLKVPGPILQLLLGDGAKVVLEGQYVISKRLNKLGFKFNYPDLNQALYFSTKS